MHRCCGPRKQFLEHDCSEGVENFNWHHFIVNDFIMTCFSQRDNAAGNPRISTPHLSSRHHLELLWTVRDLKDQVQLVHYILSRERQSSRGCHREMSAPLPRNHEVVLGGPAPLRSHGCHPRPLARLLLQSSGFALRLPRPQRVSKQDLQTCHGALDFVLVLSPSTK